MARTPKLAAGAGLAVACGVACWRLRPSACPYSQRWMLRFPRPGLSAGRLAEALGPWSGAHLLELGPGDGEYTLGVAEAVAPGGSVAALDLQQEMLDALAERARLRGVANIEPRQGDATALPYRDATFDGALLVTVLGEIPNNQAALRELRRVLRPGGRVVFGETLLDPHLVPLRSLRRRCEAAGLRFQRVVGVAPFGFYACFVAP